jgi:hypothetical protein
METHIQCWKAWAALGKDHRCEAAPNTLGACVSAGCAKSFARLIRIFRKHDEIVARFCWRNPAHAEFLRPLYLNGCRAPGRERSGSRPQQAGCFRSSTNPMVRTIRAGASHQGVRLSSASAIHSPKRMENRQIFLLCMVSRP